MNGRLGYLLRTLAGDRQAERMVPPSGFTVRLTLFTAAAMAFLAVFAFALSLATGRVAARWAGELAQSSTLRISAPADQMESQTDAALRLLQTTPGVASARALDDAEQRALLAPWFGPDLPVEDLQIPRLIEIIETPEGYDATGLRARLQAEVPGAVLDDHTRWREPLVAAAGRIRMLGLLSLLLISAATAAMITLAAQAALAANAQVIRVMRLVGATDAYIAGAFVRRFTIRATVGALIGAAVAALLIALLPEAEMASGFLTGLAFSGSGWLWPLVVPPFAGLVAFAATMAAARSSLRRLS